MPHVVRSIVAITGSSGLIGMAVARRLALHHDVVGLDSRPPRRLDALREHIHLDVTKDDSVNAALEQLRVAYGGRLASVIHLAAYYDFSGEPSPLYDEVTVRGTARLLRALYAFELEQLLFASSMLVHAPVAKGDRLNESSPLQPKWDYPRSKATTEQLLREQRRAIPLVILRIAGVYDDRCHSIPVAHQIQRIFERKLIGQVFPGDVTHGQPFVHVDDLVDAIARAVERRATLPRATTVLIGEPVTYSYETLQRAISKQLHGESLETRQIPKALAKAGAWLQEHTPGEEPFIKPWMIDLADDHYELDLTRAKRLLGWEPRRTLLGTLPAMLDALHGDPAAWYREHHLDPRGLETDGSHGQPQPH